MMKPLGTLEELPKEYRVALYARNLYPLWPSLRTLLPPNQPPRRRYPRYAL